MTEQWKPEPLKPASNATNAVSDLPAAPREQPQAGDNVIDLFAAKERLHAQNAGEQIPTPPSGPTDAASFFTVRDKHPLPLLTAPNEPRRYRVRVELDHSTPPIWRSLSLPSDIRLDRLHEVIQVAIGWDDTHLHQFTTASDPLGYETEGILTPFARAEGDEGVMESELRLDQFLAAPGDILHYTYDFGDGWDHTLTLDLVEQAGQAAPTDAAVRCLDGARQGPPEDVGGMTSYDHVLEVAADSNHREYPEMEERIHLLDLVDFVDEIDPAALNRGLARLALADAALDWLGLTAEPAGVAPVGSARGQLAVLFSQAGVEAQRYLAGYLGAAVLPEPEPLEPATVAKATAVIRQYLMWVGEGVRLTAAGFVPPEQVKALMTELDPDDAWGSTPKSESDAIPLLLLRKVVMALGLARKYRGMLVPTQAGRTLKDAPGRLWTALATKLPVETTEHGQDIGLLLLILVGADEATHPVNLRNDLDKLSSMSGWDLQTGGRFGNGSGLSEVSLTVLVLSWAATGRLLTLEDPPAALRLPRARLLARAALRR